MGACLGPGACSACRGVPRAKPPATEDAIARLTPNAALRLALGAGQLVALYLATHAIGAFMGWKVMADAEAPTTAEADDDDAELDADADEDDEGKPTPKILTVDQKQPDARVTRITRYNAFCPSCVPAEAVAEAESLPVPPMLALGEGAIEFPQAVRTQLPIALVATMEATAPGVSLATISQADGGTGVYTEGEDVLPRVELLAIDLGIVYMRNDALGGRVEYLQVSSDDPPPVPTQAPTTATPDDEPPKKPAAEIEGASDSIKCNGYSCTVERKFIDQLLANPAVLATQGNARHYAREDLKGFRLSRVKNGTLPKMLGLRSGDVITGINGQPLDSLDSAMRLFPKLRNASHLTVDVMRNSSGNRQEIRLDVSIL